MGRMGRPPVKDDERRRSVGVSLSGSEAGALRELSDLLGESQGSIVGRLVVAALKRERKKAAG